MLNWAIWKVTFCPVIFLRKWRIFGSYFFIDHNGNFCISERCQKQLQIVKSNLFLSMNSEQQCKPLQTCLENVLERALSREEQGVASPSSMNMCLSDQFANKGVQRSLCRVRTYSYGNRVTLQLISPWADQEKVFSIHYPNMHEKISCKPGTARRQRSWAAT